jgi:hypothetical protein
VNEARIAEFSDRNKSKNSRTFWQKQEYFLTEIGARIKELSGRNRKWNSRKNESTLWKD